MKKSFNNRIDAVDWIADFVENEGQFEVLREQLSFNHIYSGQFYLEIDTEEDLPEVVVLPGKSHI